MMLWLSVDAVVTCRPSYIGSGAGHHCYAFIDLLHLFTPTNGISVPLTIWRSPPLKLPRLRLEGHEPSRLTLDLPAGLDKTLSQQWGKASGLRGSQ